jgi:hypothetical protein
VNNKVKTLLASLMLVIATLAGVAASSGPANAGWPGGSVVHAADDSGYLGRSNSLFYHCESRGVDSSLYRGEWSRDAGSCSDTDYIYAFPEEEVVCFDRDNTRRVIRYPGGSVGDFGYWKCYMQLR